MALNALRASIGRMGFSVQLRQHMTAPDGQGLGSLDEFRFLQDDDVEALCKTLRSPGGTIANPDAAIPGQPARVRNPGFLVSLRAEQNLKLMCYYIRFKHQTSRDIEPADIDLNSVRELRDHREWEKDHSDVDPPEINARNWPATIEAIEEYLRGCLGSSGIPLSYVIRDNTDIPAADPPNGYPSLQDELVARAPINTPGGNRTRQFRNDNIKVWEKISNITRDHECWTYVRPAQQARDGRAAFFGLKQHYLGANSVDNQAARAESKLNSLTYTAEKKRWNFEKYVREHKDQHQILERLTAHGYAGIDARSKVRLLMAGIKTKDLDPVKTTILSNTTLRNNFDACVNLFQDFIHQNKSLSTPRDANISALGTKRPPDPDLDESKADMTIPDRYYTEKEYQALSAEQKLGLKIKRSKRGHVPGSKSSKKPRKIKALTTTEPEDTTAAESSDSDSSDSEDEEVPIKPPNNQVPSNRTNKALQRKTPS